MRAVTRPVQILRYPQGRFSLERESPLNAKPLLRAVPPAILYWVTDTRNKRTSTMILEVSSCKSLHRYQDRWARQLGGPRAQVGLVAGLHGLFVIIKRSL
ncbi:hypothetical protein SCLCIDRAFT_1218871 [Scleroderma citrinum Foug A]|uniref:Uncharacterized protein n=1 Tax=Scleroderma citrinum Foug A TaxID=1036808 RepID=A0A0C3DQ48_9AGAM|nr:hypothetical protein SCLCIDRAFT_1218871 [Scleroderma citrinum Foug A]